MMREEWKAALINFNNAILLKDDEIDVGFFEFIYDLFLNIGIP